MSHYMSCRRTKVCVASSVMILVSFAQPAGRRPLPVPLRVTLSSPHLSAREAIVFPSGITIPFLQTFLTFLTPQVGDWSSSTGVWGSEGG